MTEPEATFRLSDRFLTRVRQFLVMFAVAVVAVVMLAALALEGFDLQKIGAGHVYFTLVFSAILAGAIILQNVFTERKWRQLRIHVHPGKLVREAGAAQQEVAWEDITSLRIFTNRPGEPRVLEVASRRERPLSLFSIEPMSDLARLVQARVPATALVESKRQWLDWENPWLKTTAIFFVMIAGLLIFATAYRFAGRDFYDVAVGLLFCGAGVLSLLYRPVSKSNPAFNKYEIVWGSAMAIFGLVRVALAFCKVLAGHCSGSCRPTRSGYFFQRGIKITPAPSTPAKASRPAVHR